MYLVKKFFGYFPTVARAPLALPPTAHVAKARLQYVLDQSRGTYARGESLMGAAPLTFIRSNSSSSSDPNSQQPPPTSPNATYAGQSPLNVQAAPPVGTPLPTNPIATPPIIGRPEPAVPTSPVDIPSQSASVTPPVNAEGTPANAQILNDPQGAAPTPAPGPEAQKVYMPWDTPIPGGRLATQEEIRASRLQKVSEMELRRMRGVGSVASAGLQGVGIKNVGELAAISDERCNEIAGACRNVRALRAAAQQLISNATR